MSIVNIIFYFFLVLCHFLLAFATGIFVSASDNQFETILFNINVVYNICRMHLGFLWLTQDENGEMQNTELERPSDYRPANVSL